MSQLESFSTAGLDPRRKLEYWNDAVCATFAHNQSDPLDVRNFSGKLSRTKLGDMRLAEVYSHAPPVRHPRAPVARARTAMFFVHMPLEGWGLNRQDGREARLGPGDFTICDTS